MPQICHTCKREFNGFGVTCSLCCRSRLPSAAQGQGPSPLSSAGATRVAISPKTHPQSEPTPRLLTKTCALLNAEEGALVAVGVGPHAGKVGTILKIDMSGHAGKRYRVEFQGNGGSCWASAVANAPECAPIESPRDVDGEAPMWECSFPDLDGWLITMQEWLSAAAGTLQLTRGSGGSTNSSNLAAARIAQEEFLLAEASRKRVEEEKLFALACKKKSSEEAALVPTLMRAIAVSMQEETPTAQVRAALTDAFVDGTLGGKLRQAQAPGASCAA